MLKAEICQRKEYLFKKNEEIKKKLIYEKKSRLKKSIEENKEIPSDLKKESDILLKEIEYEDINTSLPQNILDNEYYDNNFNSPKILVTTSRNPSQRLIQFLQEIRIIIPNSVRVNRGNIVLKDIIRACKQNDYSDLIILHENRGNPDGMIISHMPSGPTIYFGLFNVVLRHDINVQIDHVSQSFPHLIFNGFNNKLGERIIEILKNLFPVPKSNSNRVLTFHNNDDFISFRHHNFEKKKKINSQYEINLEEVGPRFEMKPYQILLGTVDQPDSNKEWALRPFMRTAKNKKNL
jgi:U3 small nucleolar ribonucleoprotein protein IMP4